MHRSVMKLQIICIGVLMERQPYNQTVFIQNGHWQWWMSFGSTLTALASFPGSGNTWARHLIEHISGIHTGSVYNDGTLRERFKGEGHRDNVVAIKTHERNHDYDNAILLSRRPQDAILAYFHYNQAHSHTANANPSLFDQTAWQNHVKATTKSWKGFYLSWLNNFKGGMLLLSYTSLQQDFFNEMHRLSDFLNVSTSYASLWCAFVEQEGNFHRKPVIKGDEIYTEDMLYNIRAAEDEVDAALRRVFGNDTLRTY